MTARVGEAGDNGVGGFLRAVWRRRELLRELVRRDVEEAYSGAMFARFWAFAHPLLIILLYLFVFGYVFVARLGGGAMPAEPDFAVYMLAGLASWLTAQAALAKATSSLLAASNLVKQVVFPIELLPVRSVVAAQLPLLIGVVGLTIYVAARFGMVSPLLPLVLYVVVAQAAMLVGFGLALAALAVFVRDVRDLVQFFSAFGMFLLPVIYLPGSIPDWFEIALHFNPLSYAVWCLQDIFFFQSFRHPYAWFALAALAGLSLWAGVRFFERTRGNFGDVL